jgi:hypothetical protein
MFEQGWLYSDLGKRSQSSRRFPGGEICPPWDDFGVLRSGPAKYGYIDVPPGEILLF